MPTHRKPTRSRDASSTDVSKAREENVLARWSRRKTAARIAEREQLEEPDVKAAPAQVPKTPESQLPQKTDADIPPVDDLDQNSDYAQFMSPKVSEKVRQAALKKLFQLPGMNIVDGLDDYAEDYTYFTPLGDIITADMRHHMEREAEELKKRALESGEEVTAEQPETREPEETSAPELAENGSDTDAPAGDADVADAAREQPRGEDQTKTDSG